MRDRLLVWAANVVRRWPWPVAISAIVLAVGSIIYASNSLLLNANTDDLIAADRPFMQEYRRFLEEFGDLEYIYVVVEDTGDAGQAREVVEQITQRLRTLPNRPTVYGWIEPHEQWRIATRAMELNELEGLAMASAGFPALLSADPGHVLHTAAILLQELIQRGRSMSEQEQQRIGAAAILLLKCIAASMPESSSAQDLKFLIHQPPREYFTSDTGRFHFITVMPAKDYGTLSVIEEPLRRIRAVLSDIAAEYPKVNIGLTGKPVLQADEMATSNADMTIAAMVAFGLCAALFMISFGGVRLPLLAVIAFACAGAWTYGFATGAVGQLNLLSIVFMLVLVGVGMDYGVHVLSRYRESKREGSDVPASIKVAVLHAGRGNVTGAVTSSIVFFMALLTDFQGLRELGLIAGGGLILCVLAMTLVLPALLLIVERRRGEAREKIPTASPATGASSSQIWDLINARPGTVLAIAALSTLGLVFAPGNVQFEYNLLKLQAEGVESVEWEHRILEDSAAASWFGASIARDEAEALAVILRAREYSSIGAIRSVFDIVQPSTPERERLRQQLHESDQTPAQVNEGDLSVTPERLDSVARNLDLIALGARASAPDEAQELALLGREIRTLAERLSRNGETAEQARHRLQQTIAAATDSLLNILQGDLLSLRDALPDALRDQYLSPSGSYLIMLHPRENVWEYQPMQQFIADLRAIDPRITGAPITHFESLGDMTRAFVKMAILSIVAIALLLWLDFRSLKLATLALIPTIIGLAWLIECMALFDIHFNLANFFSVPILIGLSVDGSVHILHRYREHGCDGSRSIELGGTRRAVIVTSLTTAIGFGCVMLAHHRGLRSLGQVMAIGSVACLIATVIILPALLALVRRS